MASAYSDDLLSAIRLRAYFLWEEAGRPDGGDIAFWDQARAQIEAEQAGVPVPPSARAHATPHSMSP